jgi:hypothetical protein
MVTESCRSTAAGRTSGYGGEQAPAGESIDVPVGSVRGVVVDETGAPIQGAAIYLLPVDHAHGGFHRRQLDLTNGRGEYSFRSIHAGEYLLSIHAHSGPFSIRSFLGVYYPGVVDESAAERIQVDGSESIDVGAVRLHRVATMRIVVNVMFEDGARPARSNLLFHNPSFPHEAVIGGTAPEIQRGFGSIEIPVGFEYLARAKVDCKLGTKVETRESEPVQHFWAVSQHFPMEVTFVIPGNHCRLWRPR